MKRLRKTTGQKIRFFHCGEYGDQLGRPHYHACLFGYDFEDKLLFKNEKNPVYISSSLSDIWGKGFCTVGAVTFESAAYVARYIMKKINGGLAKQHYERVDKTTGEIYSLKPEYTTMSRRPGIAALWYHQYKDDLYPDDFVVVNNKKCKIPKFYDGMYELTNADEFAAIKLKREEEAKKRKKDNTPDRLEVKRKICESRVKQLVRTI